MQQASTTPRRPTVDAATVEKLYAQYGYALRRFAASRFDDSYGRSFVEDVVQEAFALLIARIHNGRPPRRPRAFLYVAVRLCAYNVQTGCGIIKARHVKSWKETPTLDGMEYGVPPAPDEIDDAEHRAELLNALRRLPPRERDVYLRIDYRGDTYDDVAAELGISRGCVSATMLNARNRIAWILDTGGATGAPPAGYRKARIGARERPKRTPHANAQQLVSLAKARAVQADKRARLGYAQTPGAIYAREYRKRMREEALAGAGGVSC